MKFRFWEKRSCQYLDLSLFWNQCFLTGTGRLMWYSHEGLSDVTDRFDVEPGLGITDGNGQEIYQGDIVSDVESFGTVGAVVRTEVGWWMEPCPDYRDFQELIERNRLLVVGNIHQNPDLLKRL